MFSKRFIFPVGTIVAGFVLPVVAQDPAEDPVAGPAAGPVEEVAGAVQDPANGKLLEARKLSRHRNLIQVRMHFRREILRLVNRL